MAFFFLTLHVRKTKMCHRGAWKAGWQFPNVTRPELKVRGRPIFILTLHVRKTGSSEDRAHSGESMQSNRNEEGCRLCPPEPMAAHGHVNGWREAPGWSEAEGLWRQQPTCHLVQQKGPRGHSGAEPPQKSPLRSNLLPVLGNPYRRRPSGVQTGEKSAIRTGEALLVYKLGEQRDNRASARRRRPAGSALREPVPPSAP